MERGELRTRTPRACSRCNTSIRNTTCSSEPGGMVRTITTSKPASDSAGGRPEPMAASSLSLQARIPQAKSTLQAEHRSIDLQNVMGRNVHHLRMSPSAKAHLHATSRRVPPRSGLQMCPDFAGVHRPAARRRTRSCRVVLQQPVSPWPEPAERSPHHTSAESSCRDAPGAGGDGLSGSRTRGTSLHSDNA